MMTWFSTAKLLEWLDWFDPSHPINISPPILAASILMLWVIFQDMSDMSKGLLSKFTLSLHSEKCITGWWFGTFFPYIGNNHPNWRTHIFQRDWNHQPDHQRHQPWCQCRESRSRHLLFKRTDLWLGSHTLSFLGLTGRTYHQTIGLLILGYHHFRNKISPICGNPTIFDQLGFFNASWIRCWHHSTY